MNTCVIHSNIIDRKILSPPHDLNSQNCCVLILVELRNTYIVKCDHKSKVLCEILLCV